MEELVNDPYLNSVKINLEDKRIKDLHEKEKHKHYKQDSFLSQKIYIKDYINLSEDMANLVFFISFLLLPYGVGVLFVFVIFAKSNLDIFKRIDIDEYYILWSIGYEIIAFFLLLFILKSAIDFKFKKI